jgi:hypothetical protein
LAVHSPGDFSLADSFDRSDQTPPGGPWSANGIYSDNAGRLRVVSNQLAITTGGGYRDGYLTGSYARPVIVAFEFDGTIVTGDLASLWLGDLVNVPDPSGYALRISYGNDAQLQRYVSGVGTFLDGWDLTAGSVGDQFALLVDDDDTVSGWYKPVSGSWTKKTEFTDSGGTKRAGPFHPGVVSNSTGLRLDSMIAGTISSVLEIPLGTAESSPGVPGMDLSEAAPAGSGGLAGQSESETSTLGILANEDQPLRGSSTSSTISRGSLSHETVEFIEYHYESTVSWMVLAYDLQGNFIGSLTELTERNLKFTLDGIDSFTCTMRLDHQFAASIEPLYTVIKVWRKWPGRVLQENRPDFGGIVAPFEESGGSGTFTFTAFSPIWRLKSRFLHEIYNEAGATRDQSSIIWDLIDYTNDRGATGITLGTLDPSVGRIRTYDINTQIFSVLEELTTMLGGVDFSPVYVHQDGNPEIMRFNTDIDLGEDRLGVRLDFGIGLHNCLDATRSYFTDEGEIGNFVKMIGQVSDDPESAIQIVRQDSTSEAAIGLYEIIEEDTAIQTVDLLTAKAEQKIEDTKYPAFSVKMTQDPIAPPRFAQDYSLGDRISVAANKGRMRFDKRMRVIEASITNSNGNVETSEITLIDPELQAVELP